MDWNVQGQACIDSSALSCAYRKKHQASLYTKMLVLRDNKGALCREDSVLH
jgi:hypothetical protein